MKTKQTGSPPARLLQKALIVTLVVVSSVILGRLGPELPGPWTKPAPGALIIAGLAALAATR